MQVYDLQVYPNELFINLKKSETYLKSISDFSKDVWKCVCVIVCLNIIYRNIG